MQALGIMSGTSMDGVDAAMIDTDGVRIEQFGRSAFQPYSANESSVLRAALGRWPGDPCVAEATDLSMSAHVSLARAFPEAEIVGFHGQTFAHDPRGRGTFQAGDGAALAQKLRRPIIWDFRSEDVRRGGEGAPLAPLFHWACADWAIRQGLLEAKPLAFLNLGGVGNITWVDPVAGGPGQPGACVAFDTGPANAPINDLMRLRRQVTHDTGGDLARKGQADPRVVERFLQHGYFDRPPPKSLDRDTFSDLLTAVRGLSDPDAAATLVAALAASVSAGLKWLPAPPATVLVCGGGRHNAAIMTALRQVIDGDVQPVEQVGLDGDMLEAQAFGWLAVRVLRGLTTSMPLTTGVPEPCCGGRISYPRF